MDVSTQGILIFQLLLHFLLQDKGTVENMRLPLLKKLSKNKQQIMDSSRDWRESLLETHSQHLMKFSQKLEITLSIWVYLITKKEWKFKQSFSEQPKIMENKITWLYTMITFLQSITLFKEQDMLTNMTLELMAPMNVNFPLIFRIPSTLF